MRGASGGSIWGVDAMRKLLRHWGVRGGSPRARGIGLLAALLLALIAAAAFSRIPPDWYLKVLAPGWMPHQLVKLIEYSNDLQVALVAARPVDPHPRVAIVLIREDTLADLPYISPVDRALLARIVSAIDTLGARAIGIDVLFDQATEPEKDRGLLAALSARRAEIVLGGADERSAMSQRRRTWQTQFLAEAGKPFGFFNLRYDVREAEQSYVVRARAAPLAGSAFARSFAEAVAGAMGVEQLPESRRIPWLAPPRSGGDTFVTLDAEAVLAADADPGGILARAVEPQLRGKAVLIGADLDRRDRHPTPLTLLNGEDMLGVAVHAQILAGLVDGRRIDDVGVVAQSVLGALAAGMGFLTGWFAARRRLVMTALVSIGTLAIIATSAFVLWQSQAIVPLASLTATLIGTAIAGRLGRGWVGA